jgi:hypothetical protein
MQASDHDTVASIYFRIRDFLLSDAGFSLERSLNTYDCILAYTPGKYLRLKKSAAAIGIKLGANADKLEADELNCERYLPFSLSPNTVSIGLDWLPAHLIFQLVVIGDFPKRYRAEYNLSTLTEVLYHQNHIDAQYEPNFYDSHGEYIKISSV